MQMQILEPIGRAAPTWRHLIAALPPARARINCPSGNSTIPKFTRPLCGPKSRQTG
jgi:hypothetical protein